MQKAEGRMQNAGPGSRAALHHSVTPSLHRCILHLLSSLSAALRFGADEQADAGDAALRAACWTTGPSADSNSPPLHHSTTPFLRLVWEKTPFFALAALASVVTLVVQRGAMPGAESLPLGARVANALVSYARYVGKLFWPADLAVWYPHPRTLAMGRGAAGRRSIGGPFGAALGKPAAIPLFAGGMALVCRNARPGDWTGASRRPGDGGSVHLSSLGRGADPRSLGCVRAGPTLAVSGAGFVGGGCQCSPVLCSAYAPAA